MQVKQQFNTSNEKTDLITIPCKAQSWLLSLQYQQASNQKAKLLPKLMQAMLGT